MNEEEFVKLYSILTDFLSGFVIQCYELVPDDVIIDENPIGALKNILPQAHEVLQLEPFPADAIEKITNIWHGDKSTKAWFSEIVAKLEKKVSEAEKNKHKTK
jgi:hypothetical protein